MRRSLAAMADAALDIHKLDPDEAGKALASWLTPTELAYLAPALLALYAAVRKEAR